MAPRSSATALARHGLLGDCHAHPIGPRQVLLVRHEDLDALALKVWQVRANVAIRGLPPEALVSGAVLRLGDVRIRLTHACEICSVLRQYIDRETFRRLPGRRGVLGVFLTGGELAVGSPVAVEAAGYPEVPEVIADRAAWVIARIPPGRVLTYDGLLQLVGGKRAHYRVMPRYVRRAALAGLPAHRVVTSRRRLTGHVAGQAQRLIAEGVEVRDDTADGAAVWEGRTIFWRRR